MDNSGETNYSTFKTIVALLHLVYILCFHLFVWVSIFKDKWIERCLLTFELVVLKTLITSFVTHAFHGTHHFRGLMIQIKIIEIGIQRIYM